MARPFRATFRKSMQAQGRGGICSVELTELFEILMIVSFGVSWPLTVIKAYRSRTTKGTSLPFLLLIFTGYIWGIIGKLLAPAFKWYVMFFYVFNTVMVGINLILYVRNFKLDKLSANS